MTLVGIKRMHGFCPCSDPLYFAAPPMKKLLQSLKEPFPDRKDPGKNFLSLLGVGLFVSLFLFLIRPFGIREFEGALLPICLGFGGVTVLFGWVFDLMSHYVFRIRTDGPGWTLGKWIIHSTLLVLWVAVGNYLYMNALMGWNWLNAIFLFQMLGNTLLVGIFPVAFFGLMIQLQAVKANQKRADQIQTQLHSPSKTEIRISLTISGSKELEVNASDLRYIEAMQNYVTVYFVIDGELQKEVVRSTIANMESQLQDSPMVRCHRSFLVNLDVIEAVSGNAQGLRLRLPQVNDQEVPVSRSYLPKIKELLN